MPRICKTFRTLAGENWRRLDNAWRLGLQLNEESITELALYEIARKHAGSKIRIRMLTKPKENRIGADWEFWFSKRGGDAVVLRVQAKRIYPSGKFQSLKLPGIDAQLETLIKKSKSAKSVPIYCFYIAQGPATSVCWVRHGCAHDYRGDSMWGCAFAFAESVKAIGTNEIDYLSKAMWPWHLFVCSTRGENLADAVGRFVNLHRHPQENKAEAFSRRSLPRYLESALAAGDNVSVSSFEGDLPSDVDGIALFDDVT